MSSEVNIKLKEVRGCMLLDYIIGVVLTKLSPFIFFPSLIVCDDIAFWVDKPLPFPLQKFARALASLPSVRVSEESWSLMIQKILIVVNNLLNDAFIGLEEGRFSCLLNFITSLQFRMIFNYCFCRKERPWDSNVTSSTWKWSSTNAGRSNKVVWRKCACHKEISCLYCSYYFSPYSLLLCDAD